MRKYLKIINVMCNYRDQNANKNMKLQFEIFSNKISNIEFYFSKVQIWNFEVFFKKAKTSYLKFRVSFGNILR